MSSSMLSTASNGHNQNLNHHHAESKNCLCSPKWLKSNHLFKTLQLVRFFSSTHSSFLQPGHALSYRQKRQTKGAWSSAPQLSPLLCAAWYRVPWKSPCGDLAMRAGDCGSAFSTPSSRLVPVQEGRSWSNSEVFFRLLVTSYYSY